jgi:hypothetical protein
VATAKKKAKRANPKGRRKKARVKKARKSPAKAIQRARKAAFLRHLEMTGNVTVACAQAEVGKTQVYEWRKDDIEFRFAWDDAIESAADLLEAEAFRRGVQGTRRPVYQGGVLVGHVQEYSDTLLIFLLKAARPHKFRDRVEVSLKDPLRALAEATGMPEQEVITAIREISEQKLLPAKAGT